MHCVPPPAPPHRDTHTITHTTKVRHATKQLCHEEEFLKIE